MNNAPDNGRALPRRPRIVEIIGPAGAGKTTLYRGLGCHFERLRLENFPNVRKWSDAPFFISNGVQLLPNILRLSRPNSRQLTRREFAWMSILHGWSALLSRESGNGNTVTVLDQGPIYLLAEMRLFGPDYLKQNSADGLWQDLYKRWGTTLDMVIFLDAANDVLLERIRKRSQEHVVKDQPATVVYEFLDQYRAEYDFILATLIAEKTGLRVLRFDTGRRRPEDLLDQLCPEFRC